MISGYGSSSFPEYDGTNYNGGLLVDPGFATGQTDLPITISKFASSIPDVPIFVLSPLIDAPEADEHLAEEDLQRMCTTGGHVPCSARMAAALTEAGFTKVSMRSVGFGFVLFSGSSR